jgi:2-hydroxychromene-2-carboxylate isomerase
VAREELKLYFDYKSPFAYLAAEPAFALPERYDVALRWRPFQLRIKGKGERSVYSEWKVQYSYADARRWANRRGGFRIMGPRKIYDSTPALIGALFAEREGFFREYTLETFRRFFEHRLEIDQPEQMAALVDELGGDGRALLRWSAAEGAALLEASIEEAHADHIFGVPIFVLRGELFWGHDRMPLLEERLREHGLSR